MISGWKDTKKEEPSEPFNPWTVETVDAFLYYCCPECDFQNGAKNQFITHAIANHPRSKSLLTPDEDPLATCQSSQPNNNDFSEIDIKEETNLDFQDFISSQTEPQSHSDEEIVNDCVTEPVTELVTPVTQVTPKIWSKEEKEQIIEESITALQSVISVTCPPKCFQTYTCCFCNEVFDKKNIFKAHMIKYHSKDGKFT